MPPNISGVLFALLWLLILVAKAQSQDLEIWSNWLPWSSCTDSKQTRTRSCDGCRDCVGLPSEIRDCTVAQLQCKVCTGEFSNHNGYCLQLVSFNGNYAAAEGHCSTLGGTLTYPAVTEVGPTNWKEAVKAILSGKEGEAWVGGKGKLGDSLGSPLPAFKDVKVLVWKWVDDVTFNPIDFGEVMKTTGRVDYCSVANRVPANPATLSSEPCTSSKDQVICQESA